MQTHVLLPSSESIQAASTLLQAGELVAFPTETVYGLGADALNGSAVAKIFTAKGRPSDNPLIVHIASYDQLALLVSSVSNDAKKLMQAFWPGPLTLIFPKSSLVPNEVTAGGETVAVRWPSHPVATELIRLSGLALAAPSANLSGRPSPTRAEHVLADLNGRIPLILDGGATEIGIESTVLDTTGTEPVVLRSGGIEREELERVLEKPVLVGGHSQALPRSPGMKYRHYAPRAKVVILENSLPVVDTDSHRTGFIGLTPAPFPVEKSAIFSTPREMAHQLFHVFRSMDAEGIEIIYIALPAHGRLLQGLEERVRKAASISPDIW